MGRATGETVAPAPSAGADTARLPDEQLPPSSSPPRIAEAPAVAPPTPTAPRAASPALQPPRAEQGSRPSTAIGGLSIRLDGPRSRVTEQPSARISGRVVQGTAPKLVLHVEDTTHDLVIDGRTFGASIPLKPGVNHVRVIASDAAGRQSEDIVRIEYRPPVSAAKVLVTSPVDGHTLGASDLPFVVMEGEIDDSRVARVRLIANESRIVVPVVDKKFRQVIPVLEPVVRLRAELVDVPESRSSSTISVTTPGPSQAGVLVVNWAEAQADAHVEVVAVFRARAERADTPERPVTVEAASSRAGAPKDVFVIRKMQPGVYRLVVRSAGDARLSGVPVLHIGRAGAPVVHLLGPLAVNGSTHLPLTRILLPYGVLWEQDDWFSGKSESADTITKFRSPEGVTWTERKAFGQ